MLHNRSPSAGKQMAAPHCEYAGAQLGNSSVLLHNRSAIEPRISRLAAYLGLPRHDFGGFLDWILELRAQIGIVHTLGELGVKEEHVGPFAAQALVDPSTSGNPLPLAVEDFAQLYRRAIRGDLTA